MAESSVGGVFWGYLATAVNYALSLLYVVFLTRLISLSDYGYYNAFVALAGLVALFFPSLGVDMAIAREGAASREPRPYFAALLAVALAVSTAYSAVLIAVTPFLLRNAPPGFFWTVLLYAAYSWLMGILSAFRNYLWMMGMLSTQGRGVTLYYLIFRGSQLALVLALKNVMAIPASLLLGAVAQLAYYLKAARPVRPSFQLLKRGWRRFIASGVQYWLIGYVGSVGASALSFLVFAALGAEASGLYGMALYVLGFFAAVGAYASNVLASKLARGAPLGILRDYASASVAASGLLALAGAAGMPLLTYLGIVHGDYAPAVRYAALLLGTAVLSALTALYPYYFWVSGRGFLAVAGSAVGVAVSLASTIAFLHLWRPLGLYGVVLASYLGGLASVVFYQLLEPAGGTALSLLGLFVSLSAISAFFYVVLPQLWPAPQSLILAAGVAAAYLLKPLPNSAAEQLPPWARRFALPFVK